MNVKIDGKSIDHNIFAYKHGSFSFEYSPFYIEFHLRTNTK